MRLNDLLGADVRDNAGVRVGAVIDVRLVQDGPPQGEGMARLRVAGLVVSPRRASRLLGYERRPADGPWLIRVAVLAWTRGTRFVPWEWARVGDDGAITVGRPAADLPPLRSLRSPSAKRAD
jgi:sporulation protein YlmC with PRC-barrel domain